VEGLQKKGRQKNVNPKEPEKIDGISWCSVVKVKVGIQFPLLLPVCHCLFWGVCEFIYWRRLASFLPSCHPGSFGWLWLQPLGNILVPALFTCRQLE